MKELFMQLAQYELLFIAYIIIYGFPYGFKNTLLRISTFFNGRKLIQNDWGKIGDGVFVFSIITVIIINMR